MELELITTKKIKRGINIEALPIVILECKGEKSLTGRFIAKVVDRQSGEKEEFTLSYFRLDRDRKAIRIVEDPMVPYIKEGELWNLFEFDGITENFFFKNVEIPYTEISLLDHFIRLEKFIGFLWEKKKRRVRRIKKLLANRNGKRKILRFRVDYFTYPDKPSKAILGNEFFKDTNDFLSVNYPYIEGILGNIFGRRNFVREVQAYIFERLLLRIFNEIFK